MTPRTGRTVPLAALVLAAATALALSPTTATATTATAPPAPGPDRRAAPVTVELARARLSSVPYLNERDAAAAGFVPDRYCVAAPDGAGALGYPHFNHANDGSLDPRRPAALIYEDDGHGGRRLVALEWVVNDRDQDPRTDEDRPRLFGQAFKGPLPGRFKGQAVHYALHVWLWKDNPAGRFATYNPKARCLPGTTRPPKTP
ncbi:hypothetical protein ABZY31_30095 [Streptomyces sp. NPDC006529]|uniref:hypothetical protein n=1 Tax=Streptomyces sp. NPDC006529 TaxID=3157177 RepID=UPI0033AFF075